jgi:uncharacterized delta-60 repeat protein
MNRRRGRIVVAVALCAGAAVLAGAAGAAPGDLDPSFGTGGTVTTAFPGGHASGWAVAALPNGKLVVAGDTIVPPPGNDFALARYLPDGSLDPVFDGDGRVSTDFSGFADVATALVVQPNGFVVAAGRAGNGSFALARYRRDGTLDPSFDGDGKVTTDFGDFELGDDVVLQPDGKIVVAGTSIVDDLPGGPWALARYHPDGSLDQTFGTGGKVLTDFGAPSNARAVALMTDGRIVVAGDTSLLDEEFDVALARYRPDGSLDPTFDGDGKVVVDLAAGNSDGASDLVVQGDGSIVVAGTVDPSGAGEPDFVLARFGLDGSLGAGGVDSYLDPPFGNGGIVTTDLAGYDEAGAITIEPGGKLLVAGGTTPDPSVTPFEFAVARYTVDGSLDTTFGAGGLVTTDFGGEAFANAIAVQPDGAIVAAGLAWIGNVTHIALARYLAMPCCIVGVGGAGVP